MVFIRILWTNFSNIFLYNNKATFVILCCIGQLYLSFAPVVDRVGDGVQADRPVAQEKSAKIYPLHLDQTTI